MLNRLKAYVLEKTIHHAENRYSIFVWIRQINERMARLEAKEAELAVNERAEAEMLLKAKLQPIEVQLANLADCVDGIGAALEAHMKEMEETDG